MQPEEVRAFKNELRNYNYYLYKIITLGKSIEFLYDRLGGVHGVDPSKEPIHAMPNKDLEWKIRDDITRLEAKKSTTENKLREIDDVLHKIEEPIRTAIISVYISGKQISNVAGELYLSSSGLAKRINKAIKKALI